MLIEKADPPSSYGWRKWMQPLKATIILTTKRAKNEHKAHELLEPITLITQHLELHEMQPPRFHRNPRRLPLPQEEGGRASHALALLNPEVDQSGAVRDASARPAEGVDEHYAQHEVEGGEEGCDWVEKLGVFEDGGPNMLEVGIPVVATRTVYLSGYLDLRHDSHIVIL